MLDGSGLTWATHCLKVKIRVGYAVVMLREADICTSSLMPVSSQRACGAQKCLWEREGDEKAEELSGQAFTISITHEA